MADNSLQQSRGGQYATHNAGGNIEVLVFTGQGRCQQFSILTAGTSSFNFYDGTQSTGGILLFTSLTNDPVGTIKQADIPFATGLVFKGTTGAAGVCTMYNKSPNSIVTGVNGN